MAGFAATRTVLSLLLWMTIIVSCGTQIVFPGEKPLPSNNGGGHSSHPHQDGGISNQGGVHGGPPQQVGGGGGPTHQGGLQISVDHPHGVGSGHVSGGAHVLNVNLHPRVDTPLLLFPREEVLPKVRCTTVGGAPGLCRLLVQCATFFAEIAILSRSPCDINPTQQGVCCPTVAQPTLNANAIVGKPKPPVVATPKLEQRQINFAVEQSMEQIEQRNVFERELVFNNIVAEVGSPVFLHARLFEPNDEVKAQAKNAALTLGATLNLVKKFNLSKEEAEFGLSKFSVANTIIADTCPVEPVCTETKYRSRDGSCNNLKNKRWGQAATSYQRILPPDYSDGANAPRRSVTGAPLPSARTLSRNMLVANEEVYKDFTLLIMQWGQFVTHDITHTPIGQVTINGQDVSCCERNGKRHAPENLHPECLPINILPDDPFLAQFGRECMGFVRSMPAIRRECKFGPREQINQITSYIDASNVYGSTKSVADNLREAEGGRLKVNRHEGRDLLPSSRTALGCGPRQQPPLCFLAGDVRVNEQPDLVVIHTIWMRQHNNVADELARLNPGWNNEVLYQEARRIVIAQMQHITYNEYLPIVLGQQFMVSFGLVPLSEGHANTYLTEVDASINNAFAAAAFRYGHTLVTTHVQGFSKFGTLERNLKLSQTQFAPFFLYERNSLDSLIRGLTIQPSQKFDSKFSDEVINRLFAGNGSFGLDLVALNIQRGRDHGLPSYNQWRKICHLPLAKSFNDLTDVMNLEDAQHLSTMYQHVDDIDLFVGGLLEHPKVGSLVGHTFLCIVGDQFARLKLGDRFYYENGGLRSSFSEAQLEQIRKTSLSRILCDNSDNVENMQPLAFVQGHLANRRVSCNDVSVIPKISLDPWRNEPVWV